MTPTRRLYWEDDDCFVAQAIAVAIDGDRIAFDQTCFYAGGGGQPSDLGTIQCEGAELISVLAVMADQEDGIWHRLAQAPSAEWLGQPARLVVDVERRMALTRYHTVLHVLNTITLRDYDAWITGAQIGVDYSRIDFKNRRVQPAACA